MQHIPTEFWWCGGRGLLSGLWHGGGSYREPVSLPDASGMSGMATLHHRRDDRGPARLPPSAPHVVSDRPSDGHAPRPPSGRQCDRCRGAARAEALCSPHRRAKGRRVRDAPYSTPTAHAVGLRPPIPPPPLVALLSRAPPPGAAPPPQRGLPGRTHPRPPSLPPTTLRPWEAGRGTPSSGVKRPERGPLQQLDDLGELRRGVLSLGLRETGGAAGGAWGVAGADKRPPGVRRADPAGRRCGSAVRVARAPHRPRPNPVHRPRRSGGGLLNSCLPKGPDPSRQIRGRPPFQCIPEWGGRGAHRNETVVRLGGGPRPKNSAVVRPAEIGRPKYRLIPITPPPHVPLQKAKSPS